MAPNIPAKTGEPGPALAWRAAPEDYFPTASLELVRLGLRAGLESGRGVLLLSGEVGSGKTLLLRMALQNLPAASGHTAYLSYTAMSGAEILRSVAYAFGMPKTKIQAQIQAQVQPDPLAVDAWLKQQLLQWAQAGEAVLLVIDEAQSLPQDALLALLNLGQMQQQGRSALRLILVGQTPLLDMLKAPELDGCAPWLGPKFQLVPLQAEESLAYIRSRIGLGQSRQAGPEFTPGAIEAIHQRSQGNPGRIKLLCKHLLQMAWLMDERHPIDTLMVEAQADDLGFAPAPANTQDKDVATTATPVQLRHARVGAMTGVLIAATLGLGLLLNGTHTANERPGHPPRSAATASPVQAAQLRPQPEAAALASAVTPALTPSATPVVTAAAAKRLASPAPAPIHSKTTPACANLLAKLSLGEPLAAQDRHTLESQCH